MEWGEQGLYQSIPRNSENVNAEKMSNVNGELSLHQGVLFKIGNYGIGRDAFETR
jgi:hypothetical protein